MCGWVSTTPGETRVLASMLQVDLTDISAPMRCGADAGLGFDPTERHVFVGLVGMRSWLARQHAALLAAVARPCRCAPHERARLAAGRPYSAERESVAACRPCSAGAWAEMQFDTESGYADPSGNATDQRAQVRAVPLLPARKAAPRPADECACALSALLCDACPDMAASLLLTPAGQPQLPAVVSRHGRGRPGLCLRLRV